VIPGKLPPGPTRENAEPARIALGPDTCGAPKALTAFDVVRDARIEPESAVVAGVLPRSLRSSHQLVVSLMVPH
jgi:hypothetical protein